MRQKTRQREFVVEIPDPFTDPDPCGIVDSDYDLPWYVVMCAPASEFTAQFHLRMRGYRTWLPYTKVRRRRKVASRDQFKVYTERKAFFAPYLFARVGPDQDIAGINTAEYVSRVVYAADRPIRVPESVLRALVAMGSMTGQVGQEDAVALPMWTVGAKVRFKLDSLFAGWAGTVEADHGGDVRVMLDTMGQAITARADSLEAV